MDKKQISKQIIGDIETGMYVNFDKLKSRLEHIAHKLVKSVYVADCKLSSGEIKTLKENEYL